jgi:hypothetical protein
MKSISRVTLIPSHSTKVALALPGSEKAALVFHFLFQEGLAQLSHLVQQEVE